MDALEEHKKELLRKFINGSINETERHHLERLALDDPFLFDALEGYAQSNDENLLSKVDGIILNKEVSGVEIVKTTYKPLRRLIQIAAGFLLLAAVGYFIRNEIHTNETSEQVLVDSKRSRKTVPMVQDLTEGGATEQETYLSEENLEETESDVVIPAAKKKEKMVEKRPEAQKSIPEPAEEIVLRQAPAMIEKDASSSAKVPEQQNDVQVMGSRKQATDYYVDGIRVKAELDQPEMNNEADAADEIMVDMASGFSGPYNVSGLVLDKSGEALIGATVVDNVSGKEVKSDLQGNFNIEIPQEQSMLLVKQTGYPDQYFIADHALMNNTVMEEIAPMGEISIPEEQTKDTYAEPIIGVDQFYSKLESFKSTNVTCVDRRVFIISISQEGDLVDLYRPRTTKDQCDLDLLDFMKKLGKWRTVPPNQSFLHRIEINFNTN